MLIGIGAGRRDLPAVRFFAWLALVLGFSRTNFGAFVGDANVPVVGLLFSLILRCRLRFWRGHEFRHDEIDPAEPDRQRHDEENGKTFLIHKWHAGRYRPSRRRSPRK